MHVKFFDCELFVSPHEITIKDKYGSSGQSWDSQDIPPNNVKRIVESHLVPNVFLHKYMEELMKKPINPNAVS